MCFGGTNKSMRVFILISLLVFFSIVNVYGCEGFAECEKQAKQGDAVAQNKLAAMYENGNVVAQDYEESLKWYMKSAEQGNAIGQYNVGLTYSYSCFGVTHDYKKVIKWYTKSAKQGNADAQFGLGNIYDHGIGGIVQNKKEALKWYKRSAEQGNAMAQGNLAWFYIKGWGTIQDYQEAVKWYRKMAEQGNHMGQKYLGSMYELGHGVKKDYVKAHMFYNIAAVDGYGDAQIERDSIARKMTPEQIATAQKLAREWLEAH